MTTSGPVHVDERGSVVTIGVFDGVHRGHQSLVGRARARADLLGIPAVAVTFDPHPMSVVGPRSAPPSLASLDLRVELLQAAGADAVDVLAFTPDLAAMSPEEFVHRVLVDRLHAREVVVGQDFRFGHRAEGSFATLEHEGGRHGFRAVAAPLVGNGEHRWSSSRIRELVAAGDVAAAAQALGRPYCLSGEVVHGDHRGRELGYPTANLSWTGDPAVPADGVYAGWVVAGAATSGAGPSSGAATQSLPSAISVGTNPQFGGGDRRVEAYVLDRDDLDLYGAEVRVRFAERIRGQQVFPDVAALTARMAVDVDQARALLS